MSSADISLDKTIYSLSTTCQQCGASYAAPDAICQCGALLVNGLQNGIVIAERYRYVASIGNGGMGLIVKANDTASGCDVALKLLLRYNSRGEVARFMHEAEATSSLCHPLIIKVDNFGVTKDGFPFMAMEYLEGNDLAAHLSSIGALDLNLALSIFNQVCEAMSYAHANGVIHRDLKPSNIMLVERPNHETTIKILDFGISKILRPDGSAARTQLTETGQILGSPLYMSPEQALGKKVDQRSDVYSAACVLYHALTGAPPIQGESSIETLFKHVNETPMSMTEASLGRRFPPALEALVAKGLSKDPSARYQSFPQIQKDLELISTTHTRVKNISSAPLKTASPVDAKRSKKTIALISICVIAALVLAALFANWMLHQSIPAATSGVDKGKTSIPSSAIPEDEQESATAATDDERKSAAVEASSQIVSGAGYNRMIDYLLSDNATTIDFAITGVNDSTITYLVHQLESMHKHIDVLKLNKSSITDAALKTLADHKVALKELVVPQTNITGAGLDALSRISTLEHLDISHDVQIAPGSLKALSRLTHLKQLEMNYLFPKAFPATDFAFLTQMRMLESLELNSNFGIPPAAFKFMEKLQALRRLSIEYSPITDQSLEYIGTLDSLEDLSAVNAGLTDAGVANMDHLYALTSLRLGGVHITPKCFDSLSKLRNLRQLTLQTVSITPADISKLQAAMPNCRIISIKWKSALR